MPLHLLRYNLAIVAVLNVVIFLALPQMLTFILHS